MQAALAILAAWAAAPVAVCGVVMGLASSNTAKRVAGVALAMIGAMLVLVGVGAPEDIVVAGAILAFAYVAIGAGLLVRLHEAYGATDVGDIDQEDAKGEAST